MKYFDNIFHSKKSIPIIHEGIFFSCFSLNLIKGVRVVNTNIFQHKPFFSRASIFNFQAISVLAENNILVTRSYGFVLFYFYGMLKISTVTQKCCPCIPPPQKKNGIGNIRTSSPLFLGMLHQLVILFLLKR